ncbi:MAG TPA: GTPase ObgE [Polyangiales bacterium]|nr:GTPase ObgE [Polyangiales bacterium]
MQFVDEISVEVVAGRGGDGSTAMRREKYKPLGGPAGGDGGDGGDVIFEADERLRTLFDLRYKRVLRADSGEHGRGKDQYGARGESLTVRVPVGAQLFDADTGEQIADLDRLGARFVAAKGGRGGRGNMHFATPTERAPMRAEPGAEGERRLLRIELKLLADVGIVGFPNVGKSTLISVISKARPKVADYPFTTLVPNLGVVSRGDERSFVVADIPGIIEGAAEGAGLGHRFLKHIERTRVLLVLVSVDPGEGRSPLHDLETLKSELSRFDAALATRPMIIAMSKMDLPEVVEALPELRAALASEDIEVSAFSAATSEGVESLLDRVEAMLAAHSEPVAPRTQPLPVPPHKQQAQIADDDE